MLLGIAFDSIVLSPHFLKLLSACWSSQICKDNFYTFSFQHFLIGFAEIKF